MLWQLTHCSCVSGPGRWQKGQALRPSGGSSPLSGLRTMSSIFFLYFSGTSFLVVGPQSQQHSSVGGGGRQLNTGAVAA